MLQNATQLSPVRHAIAKLAVRALKYAGIPLRDPALYELFGARPQTQSGIFVDEYSVDNFSAYYSGVNLIASTVAMLPFECVKDEKQQQDWRPVHEHIGTIMFRDGPNSNDTPYGFVEMMQRHAITWGSGYAWIQKKSGMPIAMWPLMPDQIEPDYGDDGAKIFKFTRKYPGEETRVYRDDEIFQVPGFGYDGLTGMSLARVARESIALGLATEKFGASFFGNNAVPGGIITHPGELDDVAKSNIVEEVEDKVRGPYKARRTVVLDEGMKYTPIGIPPEDSQFLQTRQFQVREISRWLRIPPHMLYDLEASNFNTTEAMGLEFLIYTLTPWNTRWAQEARRKLLAPHEMPTHTFRHNTERLLMMDTKTQFEVFASARNNSLYTINDCLRKREMPLVDPVIGDQRIAPSTMRNLGTADPSTPIAPAVMGESLELVRKLGNRTVPIPYDTAVAVLNACMPSAEDALIKKLVNTLVAEGVCKS